MIAFSAMRECFSICRGGALEQSASSGFCARAGLECRWHHGRVFASEAAPMPHRLHRFTLLRASVGLALAVWLAGSFAQSADKPRPASFGTSLGKGKPNGPLLTRAELRECMSLQARTRATTEELAAAQAALDRDKSELAARSAALKEELAVLDRTSAQAVDTYNASVQEHEKRVDAYNAKTQEFNGKVQALQDHRGAFSKGCENRDFDEKDEIAIRKGQ
jgi:hypothetical protein